MLSAAQGSHPWGCSHSGANITHRSPFPCSGKELFHIVHRQEHAHSLWSRNSWRGLSACPKLLQSSFVLDRIPGRDLPWRQGGFDFSFCSLPAAPFPCPAQHGTVSNSPVASIHGGECSASNTGGPGQTQGRRDGEGSCCYCLFLSEDVCHQPFSSHETPSEGVEQHSKQGVLASAHRPSQSIHTQSYLNTSVLPGTS